MEINDDIKFSFGIEKALNMKMVFENVWQPANCYRTGILGRILLHER